MDQLLNSRLSRGESPTKLENLSPEKFGRGAYASLTYTPSKLADNVLFKEATTLKKIQEQSSKARESEAFNGLLKDRLSQITEERDGIEQTLTQQISMYKKMLNDNEVKHENRLKDIQRTFNQEIQKLILSKEEQAKYAQSQKELLEARIYQLETELSQHKEQLEHGGSNFDQLSKNHEKLEIHYKNVCQKLEDTERRAKEDLEKAKAQYQQLSRKLYNTEVEFRGQLQKNQLQREREKENLEKLHRVELQKVQSKRANEAILKNQQLKDLAATFQSEANRLKDIINNKERNIENLNGIINQEKEKYIFLTKSSTQEITNLHHEKNRLKEEVDSLNYELVRSGQANKDLKAYTDKQISGRDSLIDKLKDQIELTQVNFMREKEKLAYLIEDLHRENQLLKSSNDRLSIYQSDNNLLCKEIRNLKDLLLESSIEMEKCKQEFLRIGRQKDLLSVKVRQLGYENQTLHRMKVQKEQEARGWRDSYYLSRR